MCNCSINKGNPLQRSNGYEEYFRPTPADVSLAEHLARFVAGLPA